jgi:hypothetical protein
MQSNSHSDARGVEEKEGSVKENTMSEGSIQWKVEAKPRPLRVMQPDARALYAGVAVTDEMCAVVGVSSDGKQLLGVVLGEVSPVLSALRFFVTDKALATCPYKSELMKHCLRVEEQCDMSRAIADFRREHDVKRIVYDPADVTITARGIAVVPAQEQFFPRAWKHLTKHRSIAAPYRTMYERIHARRREDSPVSVLAYFLDAYPHDANFESIRENLNEPVRALLCAIAAWGEKAAS